MIVKKKKTLLQKLSYIGAGLVIASAFLAPRFCGALGISPARLELENILTTVPVTGVFTISRAEIEAPETYLFNCEGETAAALDPALATITFASGEREQTIALRVDVARLQGPVAEGTCRVSLQPKKMTSGAVLPAVEATVRLTATDQIINQLIIENLLVSEGQRSRLLQVSFNERNEGNDFSAPLGAKMEVFSMIGGQLIAEEEWEINRSIEPRRAELIELAAKHKIKAGNYTVHLTVSDPRDQTILAEKEMTVSITSSPDYYGLEIGLGGVIIGAFLIWLFVKRRGIVKKRLVKP